MISETEIDDEVFIAIVINSLSCAHPSSWIDIRKPETGFWKKLRESTKCKFKGKTLYCDISAHSAPGRMKAALLLSLLTPTLQSKGSPDSN